MHMLKELGDNGNKYCEVRDNSHYTGKCRGTAYSIAINARYKTLKGIPVLLHNESNQDNHFIIKWLAEEIKEHYKKYKKVHNFFSSNTKRYFLW